MNESHTHKLAEKMWLCLVFTWKEKHSGEISSHFLLRCRFPSICFSNNGISERNQVDRDEWERLFIIWNNRKIWNQRNEFKCYLLGTIIVNVNIRHTERENIYGIFHRFCVASLDFLSLFCLLFHYFRIKKPLILIFAIASQIDSIFNYDMNSLTGEFVVQCVQPKRWKTLKLNEMSRALPLI